MMGVRRVVSDDHAVAGLRKWNPTTAQGEGLPKIPGVYRFRVPMEHDPDQRIEFLALLRWRRHGVHNILFPTFEYFVDDEFLTIPNGTEWSEPLPCDPLMLANDAFPVVENVSGKVSACPFCKRIPTIAGRKIDLSTGDHYSVSKPYRYNQLWFECCNWIAPVPRETISRLICDWNHALTRFSVKQF